MRRIVSQLGTVVLAVCILVWAYQEWTAPDPVIFRTTMLIVVLPLCLITAFCVYIWPTKWRYDRADGHLVRVERFSGRAEMLTATGWTRLGEH